MNLKINKEQFDIINQFITKKVVFGSYLYGTNNENSDKDYLCFLENRRFDNIVSSLGIKHQLQYKDETEGIDYVITSQKQFISNLVSGESTINADILLFGYNDCLSLSQKDTLKIVRSYNVIKAYLGFAKRDIKLIDKSKKNKKFHAARSIMTANYLLDNEIPNIKHIQSMYYTDFNINNLISSEKLARQQLNNMFNKNEILLYGDVSVFKSPEYSTEFCLPADLILDAVNIKEFKYDE
jgi:predicted nucleotidyltransferase